MPAPCCQRYNHDAYKSTTPLIIPQPPKCAAPTISTSRAMSSGESSSCGRLAPRYDSRSLKPRKSPWSTKVNASWTRCAVFHSSWRNLISRIFSLCSNKTSALVARQAPPRRKSPVGLLSSRRSTVCSRQRSLRLNDRIFRENMFRTSTIKSEYDNGVCFHQKYGCNNVYIH